ncbi:FYVE zinc finger [Apiospora hydei]|uniref:RING-type E3 ubiquitin transferase n=1 Tax=Apiospora hydei TaxID=1337664 RepID=A0ABR1WYZ5_9PEZI
MASRQSSADADQRPGPNDDESGSSYAGSDNGSALEAAHGARAPFNGPIQSPQMSEGHPRSPDDQDHNAAPESADRHAELDAPGETTESPTTTEPLGAISESQNEHMDGDQATIGVGEAGAATPSNQSSGERAEPAELPSASAAAEPTRVPGLTLLEALNDLTVSPRTAAGTQNELPPLPSYAAEPTSPASLVGRRGSSQSGRRGDSAGSQSSGLLPAQPAHQTRPSEPQGVRRRPSEFTLPRWQPDAEVTLCPICRTQFSIFVRKHHCRKCGRVVCANCSPHRITIPYQYIVRPPGDQALLRASGIWGEEGTMVDFSNIGGGERVRLCNPCVPDPNTTPPQSQGQPSAHGPPFSPRSSHQRSQSSASVTSYGNPEASGSGFPSFFMMNSPASAYPRNRSVTVVSSITAQYMDLARLLTSAQNSNFSRSGHAERDARTIATGNVVGRPGYYYHQSTPAGEAFASSSRQGSIQPRGHASSYYRAQYGSYPASSSSAAAMNDRPLPPPPQIPEEDECPVCHRELPSRELPNFEVLREAHINSCITSHSSYSPAPSNPNQQGGHNTPPPRAVRRTGMFPYVATEKDCVDSAECTICLEEFEEGVPMARLECLCRFHRSCITAWFVNHPGRCPVHQHDSFGY